MEGVTTEGGGAGMTLAGQQLAGCQPQSQAGGAQRQTLHETTSGQGKRMVFMMYLLIV